MIVLHQKWPQIIKPYFYDSDIFIIVCDDAKYNSIKWARNILKIHLKNLSIKINLSYL